MSFQYQYHWRELLYQLQVQHPRQERWFAIQQMQITPQAEGKRVIGGLPEIEEEQALLGLSVARRHDLGI